MLGVGFPNSKQMGHALIVGAPACRSTPLRILQSVGYQCSELDEPYSAMVEICRRPLVYRMLVVSLASLYREELAIIATVKSRFPHVEIYLAQTDGRQGAQAEAIRFGAEGLVADDGIHRIGVTAPDLSAAADHLAHTESHDSPTPPSPAQTEPDAGVPEAVLSAEELRALLADQPSFPPVEEG